MESPAVLRAHVQAIGSDWTAPGNIQHAFLNHDVCPAGALFARLEHEDDIACDFFTVLGQYVRGTHQSRGMQVMPTCVHVVIGRRKRTAGAFFHRQGIHVRAQKHRDGALPTLAAAHDCGHRA